MSLAEWVAVANMLVIAGYPIIGGTISFLHKANTTRWNTVLTNIAMQEVEHRRQRKQIRRLEGRVERLVSIYKIAYEEKEKV